MCRCTCTCRSGCTVVQYMYTYIIIQYILTYLNTSDTIILYAQW